MASLTAALCILATDYFGPEYISLSQQVKGKSFLKLYAVVFVNKIKIWLF